MWSLVGDDAVIVFELPDLDAFLSRLNGLPTVREIAESSDGIEWLGKSKIFKNAKVLISVHPTKRDDFDFIVYTEFDPSQQKNLDEFKNQTKDFKLAKRTYNGFEINEFIKNGKPIFSFALADGILAASTSSFLLEGALRLRTIDKPVLFRDVNHQLLRLPTLQSDEGNVYVNLANFFKAMGLFLDPTLKRSVEKIGNSSLSDLKITNNRLSLNGFVIDSDEENSTLALFKNQKPQRITLAPLVSNRVAALLHYGISDPESWFAIQDAFIKQNNVTSSDSLARELSRLSVNIESVKKGLGNQFANCHVNRSGEEIVTLLKLADAEKDISVFDELASKISADKRDTLYVENYSGYQIKLIDYKNFLYQLLYPFGPRSDQSFFVRIGDDLMFSESVELLKLFIDDIDNESTWGKSVEWNNYLESSLQESNVNLFFDGKLTLLLLRDKFNPKWKSFFDSTVFLGVDKGSTQLSRLDANYYLNSTFQFGEIERKAGLNNSLVKITYDFGSRITHSPVVVRSHVSKDIEVMVQDSLGNLQLVSKNIKPIWREPVNGKIIGEIKEVDFYANGKLQYFFTTPERLHIIDRLGRYVEQYPVQLKNIIPEYSSVVDYDKSKRYRFLITDTRGNLYLTDKGGNLLDGWSPHAIGGKLISSARHYRVLGKDFFLAVQQNGTAHLMNRRGEISKGFPLALDIRPQGDFFVKIGNSFSSSSVVVVSGDGFKVEFGMDGQMRKKEVLLKRNASSQFTLVKSNSENNYIITRIDPGKIGVLDRDNNLMFEIENPGSAQWNVSFLETRLKEQIFCFYDEQQDFSYFYDSKGVLLLPQPLESTLMPAMYYNESTKSLSIYNVFDSELSLISIKK